MMISAIKAFIKGNVCAMRVFFCLVVLLVAPLGVGAAFGNPGPSSPPTVVVSAIDAVDATPRESYVARVEAIDRVDLVARVSGYLEKRLFTEGQMVSKGDLLFQIEKAPYLRVVEQRQADLASAEANLRFTKADLKRKRTLAKRRDVSESKLDQAIAAEATAKADVARANAALRQARLDLSYTDIISPIDGRVGLSTYSVGNLVSPDTDPLATVVSLDPIHVTAQLSEKRILQVRRNLGFKITDSSAVGLNLVLSDGQVYDRKGRFNFLDTEVDRSADTITVRGVFPNPDHILVPGQYVNLTILPEKARVEMVTPQASILKDQKGAYLLVVNAENTVELRRVTLGAQTRTAWIVKDGITKGERVIVHGLQKVKPGMQVVPVEQE